MPGRSKIRRALFALVPVAAALAGGVYAASAASEGPLELYATARSEVKFGNAGVTAGIANPTRIVLRVQAPPGVEASIS